MAGEPEENMLDAAKLAQTIVFTSQGTPFMFAGEEVFRDKQGVHNSYKSPDSINAIDWSNKSKYHDQFEYYRGLTALRKAHPAFRMTSAADIAKNLVFDNIDSAKTPNLISYSLKNHANGDSAKEIKVVFNGASHEQNIKIPKGDWRIMVKDGKIASPEAIADGTGLGKFNGGKVTLPPYSSLILLRN